jgi:hypothetical protein
MNGRRNRRRGAEVEREIVDMLRGSGVAAEKISRSGYTGPDIVIRDQYPAECKLRKGGWKTIARWLVGVNILFLREGGKREPMVVLDWKTFVELMGGGQNVD